MLADMENVIECGVQCSMRGEGCHMFQWNDVTKDKSSNIQISKVLVSSGDVFPGNLRGTGPLCSSGITSLSTSAQRLKV